MLGDDFIFPYLTCAHPDIADLVDRAQKAKLPAYILRMHRDHWQSFSTKQFTELRSYAILIYIIYYQKITEHLTHRRYTCLMI